MSLMFQISNSLAHSSTVASTSSYLKLQHCKATFGSASQSNSSLTISSRQRKAIRFNRVVDHCFATGISISHTDSVKSMVL